MQVRSHDNEIDIRVGFAKVFGTYLISSRLCFFVSYRIGGVEVDDDVGSTWRGEVEEISSKEFDRLAPTGDRSNTDCCCERSSAYVIVLLGCELRNTERVSARESERARERAGECGLWS